MATHEVVRIICTVFGTPNEIDMEEMKGCRAHVAAITGAR
jgi:methyl coenzyme M reductase subunit C-like uncharacterized protein (methanogenesis marker protein 7)